MRIKLDENLPGGLAVALAALGHDADTVEQEGLQGRAHPDVWRAAQHEGRFFITQDLVFSTCAGFDRAATRASFWCVWHGLVAWPCCDGSCRPSRGRTPIHGPAASSC